MNWYHIYKNAQTIEGERIIRAYHGTSAPFKRFDRDHTAQGAFWFTDNIDMIKNGESGAVSAQYIAVVDLLVNKTAGWEEYERSYLQRIEDEGYDSINLYDNWVIFDANRITIREWYRRQDDGSYKKI